MTLNTASRTRRLAIGLMASAMAAGLSGCITLLPEVKPVQLYTIRFNPTLLDKAEVKAPPALPDMSPIDVFVNFDGFPRAAAGDRILTVEGNEASYIAGGRWASSAQTQFRDLMSEGFARQAGVRVRLGDQGRINGLYRLDINVRRFETTYLRRKPTVTVALDARLIRLSDRQVMAERFIASDIGLRKNELSLIAEGYEKASSQVTVDLLKFTEEAVALAEATKPADKTAK